MFGGGRCRTIKGRGLLDAAGATRSVPRHARPCGGHPRLDHRPSWNSWMPGPGPGMTGGGSEANVSRLCPASPKCVLRGSLRSHLRMRKVERRTAVAFALRRTGTGSHSPAVALALSHVDATCPCCQSLPPHPEVRAQRASKDAVRSCSAPDPSDGRDDPQPSPSPA